MSRYTDHKAEIKGQLLSITGIGNVYDSPKNPTDEASIASLFVKNGILNTVTITRADGSEAQDNAEDDFLIDTVKVDNWIITFFYAFKDDQTAPSEYAFQDLVERIEDKFRFLQDLNGKAERSFPLNRSYSGLWQLVGGVLCHKAEWRLQIQSRIYNPNEEG